MPFHKLYIFPLVRVFICWIRFLYFVKIRKRLKTINSDDAFEATLKHNLKSLTSFGGTRMNFIFRPLSVIENINKEQSKILVVGPRNEADLLLMSGYGFLCKNMVGLDLISYSPMIDVGDIHQTNYENNSFDVVVCGWVLSYSKNPKKFADECMRIVKPGGFIAIAIEYSDITDAPINSNPIDDLSKRIRSSQGILDLFDGHIEHLFYNHDAPLKLGHMIGKFIKNPSSIVVIFSTKK